ncbi:MAG: hypothetical protein JRK53_05380, partial [Deltaproteobacteria bacterium]|nr:hypothetical protein [Deltaproteobacteria bacterium]
HRPLTLVSAPAGYGKTTLISCWLETCGRPAAWLSLDEHDNDLHLFLSYFVSAVQTIFPSANSETEALLNADVLPPVSALAASMLNELSRIEKDFIFVLDDYHLITEQAVNDLLAELLSYPPKSMHLVIITRFDPPLPVARLRARAQMTEIRTEDLRFSREEIAVFLQQATGITIDESTAAILAEKTEGWVVGLRLGMLSLRHRGDLERILASLPENNRYIMDYIVSEVLSQQPEVIQEKLLMSSILNRFCASLCDAVCVSKTKSGAHDIHGQDFLDWIEQANLFVIPLDDEHRWYRYHNLFQGLLHRQLKRRSGSDEVDALHKRAGSWFADNNLVEEALRHVLAAGETREAARIVIGHREDMLEKEQWPTLRRWAHMLPRNIVDKEPELLLVNAWSLWNEMRFLELKEVLDRFEDFLAEDSWKSTKTEELQGECHVLRSFQYLLGGTFDPLSALTHARDAIKKLPRHRYRWRGLAIIFLAISHQMAGDLAAAYAVIFDSLKEKKSHRTAFHTRLLIALCHVQLADGDLKGLQQTARQQLDIGNELDLDEMIAYACFFWGASCYLRNELTEAEEHLTAVVRKINRTSTLNFSRGAFALALTYQAQGRPAEARKVADQVVRYAFETGNLPLLKTTQAFQAELSLRQGDMAEAGYWAGNYEPDPFRLNLQFYMPQLTKAKILLAQETKESLLYAAELLSGLHDFLVSIHNTHFLIDVLSLQALAHHVRGEEPDSFAKLTRALNLAEPGGHIRPFLDLGPKMANLLNHLAKQNIDIKYAGRILAAFRKEAAGNVQIAPGFQTAEPAPGADTGMDEALSKREMEILALLSQGMTNKEIAEKLFLSPHTIKTHLYNIYQKLNVKTRRQAIDKVNAIGMLGEDRNSGT